MKHFALAFFATTIALVAMLLAIVLVTGAESCPHGQHWHSVPGQARVMRCSAP